LGRCEPIDGRPRWPSTESIAKIPAATQTDIERFLELDMRRALRSAPKRNLMGYLFPVSKPVSAAISTMAVSRQNMAGTQLRSLAKATVCLLSRCSVTR
jgi:hypothetical protein